MKAADIRDLSTDELGAKLAELDKEQIEAQVREEQFRARVPAFSHSAAAIALELSKLENEQPERESKRVMLEARRPRYRPAVAAASNGAGRDGGDY